MPEPTADHAAKLADRNTNLFIAFRVCFNARFYYPVFAIIYLDFGMTLEQFAVLNSIWAATIILAEVPSGAISDLIGRKKLLVVAGALMVTEMVVWAFAPTGNPQLLFAILAGNRMLSGLAEAAASGSDEALVYDSLDQASRGDEWPKVLQSVTRWQSMAFIFALIVGGIVYDPKVMQRCADLLGLGVILTQEVTMRFPLYLNLITALITLVVTLRMIEPIGTHDTTRKLSISAAFAQTWKVGKWILATPFALMVICAGAFLDSVIRMFITLNSEYYRLIGYPAVVFGLIGAGTAIINYFVAGWSRRMAETKTPNQTFVIISAVVFTAYLGISRFIPYLGVVFSWMLFAGISMTGFTISYQLNRVADKSIRATALSFKGLALNLGYGLLGIGYALLVARLRGAAELSDKPDALFRAAAQWFPVWFIGGATLVVLMQWRLKSKPPEIADEK